MYHMTQILDFTFEPLIVLINQLRLYFDPISFNLNVNEIQKKLKKVKFVQKINLLQKK